MNRNKRGQSGEMILFFVFIFLMVMVSVGIVAGVFIFYGEGYDGRQIDADTLSIVLTRCLTLEEIEFSDGLERNFELLLKECDIVRESIENGFVIRLIENDVEKISWNNPEQCFFEGAEGNRNLVLCRTNVFSFDEKSYELTTGSNQKYIKRLSS